MTIHCRMELDTITGIRKYEWICQKSLLLINLMNNHRDAAEPNVYFFENDGFKNYRKDKMYKKYEKNIIYLYELTGVAHCVKIKIIGKRFYKKI